MNPNGYTVLLVDDEESLRIALRRVIESNGYSCLCADDGYMAIELVKRVHPDLVVLDVMMPGIDGFETCNRIRAVDSEVAILMLSAKTGIVDKKTAFHAGADDYLTKPFSEEELMLRIEASLRRRERLGERLAGSGGSHAGGTAESSLVDDTVPVGAASPSALQPDVTCVGDLVIDRMRYQVAVRGRSVTLTPKEFAILAMLASAPGRVFTQEEIIARACGEEFIDSSVSVPVYIRRIREKIEDNPSDPRYVQTVMRFGYKLAV